MIRETVVKVKTLGHLKRKLSRNQVLYGCKSQFRIRATVKVASTNYVGATFTVALVPRNCNLHPFYTEGVATFGKL